MAMAVQRLHKDAQVTIGPWIDRGFYYDFDLATPLSEKELKAIRKEMQKIIRMNLPFIREEVRQHLRHCYSSSSPGSG
jgi:threonyl-tRNA synthetase